MARVGGILDRPGRDILIVAALCVSLAFDRLFGPSPETLLAVAAVGALPTAASAVLALARFRISIEVFNGLALGVSFWTGDFRSASFIALMLASARILEWRTEARTRDAVEELMRLKPTVAVRVEGAAEREVPVDAVKVGDLLVVRNGARVPVDGVVVFGGSMVNESSVTGESVPVMRAVGDRAISGTTVESGAIKIRATAVGEDSTIERMAALMREASVHKSRSEKLADRFAGMFLPAVAVFGFGVLAVTGDPMKMASIFLVACADDIAVAVPLAISAGLGQAARRGVIVKGGEWLETLSKLKVAVIDKTGTLTFGSFKVRSAEIAPGTDGRAFWRAVGSVEKYSEHPIGRAIRLAAAGKVGDLPEPEGFVTVRGGGVEATVEGARTVVGSGRFLAGKGIAVPEAGAAAGESEIFAAVGGQFVGRIRVADVPRPEAAGSVAELKGLGVSKVVMFTGDASAIATEISARLGIAECRSEMTPEDKLRELEGLLPEGPVAMIGDGVNDAPALARADVGIAMGSGGAAVAVEAADVVIATDDLSRLPETVRIGRAVHEVIRGDMAIWAVSNLIGFALVLTGFLGPALAAFYNFATDFLPIVNSLRLYRDRLSAGGRPSRIAAAREPDRRRHDRIVHGPRA